MAKKTLRDLADTGWDDVLAWLPPDINELARMTGAILKRREIKTGDQLLRLVFAYCVLDLSLRSTAAWAHMQQVASLSDVAVYKRLAGAVPFLTALLGRLINVHVGLPPIRSLPWRVRLIDATTISHPGSTGTDWRVHATYDAARGWFDAIEVTDGKGGEHLERATPAAGDLIVADRGYAHAERIASAREAGAHVLVRIGHSAIRMWTHEGEPFDVVAFASRKRARPGRPPCVEETAVRIGRDHSSGLDTRIIIIRKPTEPTNQERRRIRSEAKRKGRTPTKRTLDAAAFSFLLTTVPRADADADTIAELYRVRWQIELAFKRWKSLLHLDALRARDPALARAYILGKIIAAVLVDTLTRSARAFSPWGIPTITDAKRLAGLPVGP